MPSHGSVLIFGGSGFLGTSLAVHLVSAGFKVVIVSRSEPTVAGPWQYQKWDARSVGPWVRDLEDAQAIVNLAGRSVDCVKAPDNCDAILRSRVEATRAIASAVRAARNPPGVWVQMSTAHIYGDPAIAICDEESALGVGLAPTVGKAWEEAAMYGALSSQRLVVLRTGFVIGRDRGAGGGALSRLRTLARLGLGGQVGSGSQGFSWIHELDMNRIFERAINNDTMRGVYNAAGPNPTSQREFMRAVRKTSGGLGALGIAPSTPAWAVRIGAPLLMKTDPELALYGRYVVPKRLLAEGFEFQYPILTSALQEISNQTVSTDSSTTLSCCLPNQS